MTLILINIKEIVDFVWRKAWTIIFIAFLTYGVSELFIQQQQPKNVSFIDIDITSDINESILSLDYKFNTYADSEISEIHSEIIHKSFSKENFYYNYIRDLKKTKKSVNNLDIVNILKASIKEYDAYPNRSFLNISFVHNNLEKNNVELIRNYLNEIYSISYEIYIDNIVASLKRNYTVVKRNKLNNLSHISSFNNYEIEKIDNSINYLKNLKKNNKFPLLDQELITKQIETLGDEYLVSYGPDYIDIMIKKLFFEKNEIAQEQSFNRPDVIILNNTVKELDYWIKNTDFNSIESLNLIPDNLQVELDNVSTKQYDDINISAILSIISILFWTIALILFKSALIKFRLDNERKPLV